MRAGRPRSQGNHSPLEGESQKPSRQAKADAVGGGRRATSQKADVHPLGNSRLPASRAQPCRADHSRENGRSSMKMNHEWTRINTKTDGPPSTTKTDGPPSTRAQQRLPKCFLPMGFLPTGWLPAIKAQRGPKGQDAGGTPALPGQCRPGGAVGGVRRVTSQKADVHPLGNSRLPANPAPALPCGSFEEKRPIVIEDEPRMDTNRHKDKWTCFNHKRHHNTSAIGCPWCVTAPVSFVDIFFPLVSFFVALHGPLSSLFLEFLRGLIYSPKPDLWRLSPPLGSTGNGAMALLRLGRWGSHPQGGCLQHRTSPQPALFSSGRTPAPFRQCRARRPWGVSGG